MSDKNILDRKFLEFWGNLFLNMAKGQEQIEQLSSLMNFDSINNMDFMNFKEMAKMFRKSYGLPLEYTVKEIEGKVQGVSENMTDAVKLKESFEAFQSSFAKYITMWGWIPKSDYEEIKKNYDKLKQEHSLLEKDYGGLKQEHSLLKKDYSNLKQKYESLKQRADIQEELMSQLRNILNEKGIGHLELFQNIQNIAKKQTGEFQAFILNLQNLFKSEKSNEK